MHHHFPRQPRHWRAALCVQLASAMLFGATHLAACAETLTFDAALRAAQERAPMLRARRATMQGAQALQIGATQLPDPRLTLGIDSLPVNGPNRASLTRDDFTQRQIGFMQEVPNQAKRAARGDAAQARFEREQALLHAEQIAVRREAGLAWLASHYANRRLRLFDELLGHHRLLQQTAPSQLAAGRINPIEMTMINAEALTLADRRDALQREAAQAAAVLRRWAGDAATTAGDAPALMVDRAQLLQALERNPEVAAFVPMRAMAEAEIREAQAALQGDWGWSVSYGKRGPGFGDLLSVQFTFELPLAREQRQQPQIHAKLQETERIAAERDELLRRLTQEVDTLLADHTELTNGLQRLREQALPLAEQRATFALTAYATDRDQLAGVLEARKQQTDLQLRVLEVQAQQQAVLWRLKVIVPEQTP